MSRYNYPPEDQYGNWPDPHDPWRREPKPAVWDKKPLDTAKPVTISDLFPRLDRLSIGWSPLLETLKAVTNNKPSYPPYDIVVLEEGVNLLNVAVAGFSKKEISITIEDSVLTIEGKKKDKQKGDLLYQGIATRDFKLELAVAEYWEVTNALMDNGMLTVQFNKILPEEKKPRVIDIK